jgi:hypothetical protein
MIHLDDDEWREIQADLEDERGRSGWGCLLITVL